MSSNEQKDAKEQISQEVPDVEGEVVTSQQQSIDEQNEQEQKQYELQLAELKKQLDQANAELRNVQLRAQADVENIRRRSEADVEKAYKFSIEKFANELLPVIDSLERAQELSDKENAALKPMIEGVELTHKSMLDAVKKFGIEVVSEINIPFDPEVHQAMSMVESDEVAANHVVVVVQRGYRLNGRLLRPAMVIVSKEKSVAS